MRKNIITLKELRIALINENSLISQKDHQEVKEEVIAFKTGRIASRQVNPKWISIRTAVYEQEGAGEFSSILESSDNYAFVRYLSIEGGVSCLLKKLVML